MSVRRLTVIASLLLAASAQAQSADEKAARNATNWDVFLKLYPPRALAAREEGAVGFLVTLDKVGNVTGCEVTHSSGHPLLDQETCNIVTLHAQFSPDPSGSAQTRTHEGLIAWKLPQSTTQLAVPAPVTATSAPEKVICKRTVKIGTLAGFERTCMTPTEWARQTDEMKQVYEEFQGKKGSSSCDFAGVAAANTPFPTATPADGSGGTC
jgi:protein TonB